MPTFREQLFEKLTSLYEETTGHTIQLVKQFEADRPLYRYGEIPKGIYYINKGSVKVTKYGSNGREIIIRIARAHDFVGYLSLLKGWSYKTTAICLEEAEVYFIAKTVFIKSIKADPEFGYQVIRMLCDRLGTSDDTIEGLATKSVRERLSTTLLTLSKAELAPDGVPGFIKLKRKDIASMIGTIPETLSRQLTELEHMGFLKNHDKFIEILNREELTKISKLVD